MPFIDYLLLILSFFNLMISVLFLDLAGGINNGFVLRVLINNYLLSAVGQYVVSATISHLNDNDINLWLT